MHRRVAVLRNLNSVNDYGYYPLRDAAAVISRTFAAAKGRILYREQGEWFLRGKIRSSLSGNRYRRKFTHGSALRRESKGHCYLPSPALPFTFHTEPRKKIFLERYFPASWFVSLDKKNPDTSVVSRRFFLPSPNNHRHTPKPSCYGDTSMRIIQQTDVHSDVRARFSRYTIPRNVVASVSRGINAKHWDA